jgi:hypothetical protein
MHPAVRKAIARYDVEIVALDAMRDALCERAKGVNEYSHDPIDSLIAEFARVFKCKTTKK